ncbi:MAG: arylsulfatase [Verrucomicrobiota bacterium]
MSSQKTMPKERVRQNIVVILTDDLGYGDCSCYGQETWETPNIDGLAAEGKRFTNFYTTSPVCSPARASLLAGMHSGRMPIRNLEDSYLPDSLPTLPWGLKEGGYLTACIGKYGVGSGQPDVDPIRKGFDYHFGYNCMYHAHNFFPPFLRENGLRVPLRNKPPEGDDRQWRTGVGVAREKIDYTPDLVEARALEFIRDCAETDHPFFLYYCPNMPHANNEGGDTPDGMEVDTYGDFEDRDWKPNEKGFARMVQRIDSTVGRVRETLEELGIAENTLVIFTSDNGPHNEGGHSVTRFNSSGGFQGYKRSLHEGGIRIPFIVWQPGTVSPETTDHIGYFPDLMPTLLDIAGVKTRAATDGNSIRPLLHGDGDRQRQHDHLYFEFNGQVAVRRGDWKYFRDAKGNEALYNLADDRHEDSDLKDSEHAIFAELQDTARCEHRDYAPTPAPPFYDAPAPFDTQTRPAAGKRF